MTTRTVIQELRKGQVQVPSCTSHPLFSLQLPVQLLLTSLLPPLPQTLSIKSTCLENTPSAVTAPTDLCPQLREHMEPSGCPGHNMARRHRQCAPCTFLHSKTIKLLEIFHSKL